MKGVLVAILIKFSEMLVFRSVYKVVSSPEFINRFLDAVIGRPRFTAPVVAFFKLNQGKLVTQ